MTSEEFLAEFLAGAENWMDKASCKGLDPDSFQMKQGQSARERKKICNLPCPVKNQCYEYGVRTGSVGVWGGQVLTLKREPRSISPVVTVQDSRPQPIASPARKRAAVKSDTFQSVPVRIAARKLH